MSLKIWILFMFGFAIYLRSSGQFCVRRFVNDQWISKGDCGGPGRMSEKQKELEHKIKEEKKCISGHGWTVFQRRINGYVDFNRNWTDYVKGFGNCEGDFWLGLEKLHEMTKDGNMELEINMIEKSVVPLFDGTRWEAKYRSFIVGPGSDNYTLHVSGYSGNTTSDHFSSHNNRQFSTYDADHDGRNDLNCAFHREGGWWYDECGFSSSLNGNFHKTQYKGIWWGLNRLGIHQLLRFSEMKIRRRS